MPILTVLVATAATVTIEARRETTRRAGEAGRALAEEAVERLYVD